MLKQLFLQWHRTKEKKKKNVLKVSWGTDVSNVIQADENKTFAYCFVELGVKYQKHSKLKFGVFKETPQTAVSLKQEQYSFIDLGLIMLNGQLEEHSLRAAAQ